MSASVIDGVAAVVAFTMLGFLAARLIQNDLGEDQQRALIVETVLLLVAGCIALLRMRSTSVVGGRTASSFTAMRLLVDTVANSPGVDAISKAILTHARSHTKSELAALVMLGETSRSGEITTLIGDDVRQGTVRFDGDNTLLYRRALVDGKPVTVNGGSKLSGAELPPYYPSLRNFLAAPIRINGEVLGELFVANKGSSFGAEEEACLATLATFLAPIIANHDLAGRVRKGYLATVEALVRAIEAKDSYTKGHSENVALFAVAIAREMGFTADQLEEMRVGGVLHDVGKIGVPEMIINKNNALTEEEWAIIKEHPRVAAKILDPFNTSKEVLAMVYHHHERYDGKGYPAGLRGNDIPLAARILKVADSFEAMVSNRAYRAAMSRSEAMQELKACSGTQFDPAVVTAFMRALAREWGPSVEERMARPPSQQVPEVRAHYSDRL